jgi:hypothetical protein
MAAGACGLLCDKEYFCTRIILLVYAVESVRHEKKRMPGLAAVKKFLVFSKHLSMSKNVILH